MYTINGLTFSLENFVGPLELLLCLIHKEEVDICGIALKDLTLQFLQALERDPEVEMNSETLSLATTLLLVKSQKLLPQEQTFLESEEDSRLEIIQDLIEYCRFKETAKALSEKENVQKTQFLRAASFLDKEPALGLETIAIHQLKTILTTLLSKAVFRPQQLIHEETWQVSCQLALLEEQLGFQKQIPFNVLFSSEKCRMELIVLFLALLEMMKHQKALVVKENENLYITRYDKGT